MPSGIASGMGIAVADVGHGFWIGLAGAAFLVYLGSRALTAPALQQQGEMQPGGWCSPPASRLRRRLGPRLLRAINVVSGLSILGFAAWQVAGLFR